MTCKTTSWTGTMSRTGRTRGVYDVWHAVYPPLSFVFIRLFSRPSCYWDDAFSGRDCRPGRTVRRRPLLPAQRGLGLQGVWRAGPPHRAGVRAAVIALGLPMVWGLERGNLIIPTFTAFVLSNGRVLRSGRLRQLAHAFAINFKPYLVLLLLPQAIPATVAMVRSLRDPHPPALPVDVRPAADRRELFGGARPLRDLEQPLLVGPLFRDVLFAN